MESRFRTVPISELEQKGLRPDTTPPWPYVLVVDDEQLIADSIASILRLEQFATAVAYDAETALQIAELAPPEILVADINLPGLDGIELAAALWKSVSDCKVILMSGQAHLVQRGQKNNAGVAFRVLQKPVHPRDLLTEVALLMALPAGRARERS